jgi:type IX secretion system PorP/SprF family membrane protein
MMMGIFRNVAATVLLCLTFKAGAQSDIKLSSFFLIPMTYNPAYAGSYEGITLTSVYSSQWVGFEGAPKTFFVNGHGTFLGPKTGIGAELVSDEIGVTKDTRIIANFAYHINLSENWRLSMGIKSGGSWYSVDYNRLSIEAPNEINGLSGEVNENAYIFGTGFYLHNDSFFFGLGIPNLLKTKYYDAFRNTIANSTPNFYLSTGYRFDLRNDWYFQPMLLTRVAKGAPVNSLFAGTFEWNEKLYASLNMDLKATIGGFFGLRVYESFFVGYSYDTSINSFRNSNDGIHTFFLNFRLEDYWQRKRCGCYTF